MQLVWWLFLVRPISLQHTGPPQSRRKSTKLARLTPSASAYHAKAFILLDWQDGTFNLAELFSAFRFLFEGSHGIPCE